MKTVAVPTRLAPVRKKTERKRSVKSKKRRKRRKQAAVSRILVATRAILKGSEKERSIRKIKRRKKSLNTNKHQMIF